LVASGGIEHDFIDTGVIAQEIQKILPDAVRQQKGRILVNGEFIEDFLLINKDRIFMENIGAIKELCKLTGSLETRIQQLERINSRLSQRKESSLTRAPSPYKQIAGKQPHQYHQRVAEKSPKYTETFDYCSNKMIQAAIVVLILVILASLSCLSTLYFVEHSGQPQPFYFMSGIRGNGGGGAMGTGSDINSIQKQFLPKMNGKYYTFAPHAPQVINPNQKLTASHDNPCTAQCHRL
jgi:Myelin regulatory factor ICA domain